MTKVLNRWPLLAAIGLSATASAQSAVTIYGIIDAGTTYVSNAGGKSKVSLTSGILQQSRLGFKGTEDLGGGLSAIFTLENAFNVDDGSIANDGAFFSRQSWVGLKGASGTIMLGRQPTVTSDTIGRYTSAMLLFTSYLTTHPGDYDQTLTLPVQNSIKYVSPVVSGFSGEAQYVFGEVAGTASKNAQFNVGGNYVNGNLSIGASYLRANGFNIGSGGLLSAAANPFGATSVNDMFKSFGIGASYQFSSNFVNALVTQSKFDQGQSLARTYEIGFRHDISPRLIFGADYNYTDVFHKARLSIVGAMLDYKLSKRTDIYLATAYERVSGKNQNGGDLVAQLNGMTASGSSNQLVTHLGLRHSF